MKPATDLFALLEPMTDEQWHEHMATWSRWQRWTFIAMIRVLAVLSYPFIR